MFFQLISLLWHSEYICAYMCECVNALNDMWILYILYIWILFFLVKHGVGPTQLQAYHYYYYYHSTKDNSDAALLDIGMVLTVPRLEACSIPCMSKSRHASRAHAMTASFFLPDTVASATKTSPLGPSTGSLCERTAQNSEEITGPSTKGQHKTVRKLLDHPQKDSTKQWGNYRTIHRQSVQKDSEKQQGHYSKHYCEF